MTDCPDYDAIEARANAATEGPWLTGVHAGVFIFANSYGIAEMHERSNVLSDTEFITNARTDIPALIARCRELEAEKDNLTARLIEAADALSPAIGATVGGRGVAIAAKQLVARLASVRALADDAIDINTGDDILRAILDSKDPT